MTHHRSWRLIHGELSRLAPSKWRFVCINNEKCFRTVWKELAQEFPAVFDQCEEQTLWNSTRDTEVRRPLTQSDERRRKSGIPQEQIAQDRLWNKRLDGVAFKIPTNTKAFSSRIKKRWRSTSSLSINNKQQHIFRCSSPPHNLVYGSRVAPSTLAFSLSSHRHFYMSSV
jgi:hypothetical protein